MTVVLAAHGLSLLGALHVRLVNFRDASHFHNRGFLLPICEASGLVTICVDATKGLAILVKHRHLPVTVLSPLVFPK